MTARYAYIALASEVYGFKRDWDLADDKECEITVESDPEKFDWALWQMSALTVGEIDASGVEDMVNKIEEYKKKNKCKCIKKLTIMGHGGPGVIEIGNDVLNAYETSRWKPILDKLKGNFCKDGEITLAGCWVGSEDAGATLLSLIANNLGVRVNAPTTSITQFWSGPGDQEAKPGQPPPKPIPGDFDQTKKKKPKNKKSLATFNHEGKPYAIDPSGLKAFAILKPEEKPDSATLREYYNSSKLFSQFADSLDIFDPISIVDMPFRVEAHVYFWLQGEDPETKPLIPPSYLVGGYRYLVLGGDWTHTYRVTGGMHMKIREYGRYPSLEATLEKYSFLRKRFMKYKKEGKQRKR